MKNQVPEERIEPTLCNVAPTIKEPEAANNNEAQALPVPPLPPAVPGISKKKKILSAVFNMAVGAGLTAVAKTAVVSAMITCPPLAILLASSFAVGAVMTGLCHEGKRRADKKENAGAPDFFSKQNAKNFFNKQNARTFTKSSLFALVGGALVLGFQEGIIQDGFRHLFGSTPAPAAVPTAPVVTTVPVQPALTVTPADVIPVHCPSPLERFTSLIQGHDVSDRVQDALHRTASANPHVAAQASKDLAYFSFNGFDGVPKDQNVALGLFQKAAESGNVQSKIDLLYTQYHGLGGVTANPQAALEGMQQINTPRAAMFTESWGGHATEVAKNFDSKAILQGVKFCPTPA